MRIRMLCFAALVAVAGCGNDDAAALRNGDQIAVSPDRISVEALKTSASDDRLRHLYQLRSWQPLWSDDRAAGLEAALAQAGRHGIDADRFRKRIARASSPADREAALSAVALAYAAALANGEVDPTKIYPIYTLPRPKVDLVSGLNQAAENGRIAEWLASLAPQSAEYRALSDALLQYRRKAAEQQTRPIPGGDLIHVGDTDPRIPAIVAALRRDGYPADVAKQSNLYTPQIAAAVKALQQDSGLAVDGVIGADTLDVLNSGAADRARTIALNLERLRWLNRTPPATRIDVNTAAATLAYWRDGAVVHRARVVAGQPGKETPQIAAPITRLVANPNWTVPKSIAQAEIIPKDPAYMRRNNMVWKDGWIVQRPGPNSALGLVKFDMDDPYAIYLHDTPAKALFDRSDRHLSHGCVRVEDALAFARALAGQEGVAEEFEKAMASGDESFVSLPKPIPVRLLYQTAFVGEDGRIVFRPDVYGWDEDLARALGLPAKARSNKKAALIESLGP